jgi:hypothetical protein
MRKPRVLLVKYNKNCITSQRDIVARGETLTYILGWIQRRRIKESTTTDRRYKRLTSVWIEYEYHPAYDKSMRK